MRILIISDLHANWEALVALVAVTPRRPDAVLFLGDAVGYGPDPARCVAWLRANMTAGVMGNHDSVLARMGLGDRVVVGCADDLEDEAYATLAHALQTLDSAGVSFLGSLPSTATVELDGARFFLAHGTPADPLLGTLDLLRESQVREAIGEVEADVVLLGHSHVPAMTRVGKTLVVNPGSLGQPRHGNPDGTFAMWEDGRVQIRHLHYDHLTTRRKLSLLPVGIEQRFRLQHILAHGQLPPAALT